MIRVTLKQWKPHRESIIWLSKHFKSRKLAYFSLSLSKKIILHVKYLVQVSTRSRWNAKHVGDVTPALPVPAPNPEIKNRSRNAFFKISTALHLICLVLSMFYWISFQVTRCFLKLAKPRGSNKTKQNSLMHMQCCIMWTLLSDF